MEAGGPEAWADSGEPAQGYPPSPGGEEGPARMYLIRRERRFSTVRYVFDFSILAGFYFVF